MAETRRVIQVNLNHCREAHDMLHQRMAEDDIHIALVSEPYSVSQRGWIADTSGRAAIYLRNNLLPMQGDRRQGFVAACIAGCEFVSVYFSPNTSRAVFETGVDELRSCIRRRGRRCIIAGDFNAKAAAWGERATDHRGETIIDMAAEMDLHVCNTGDTYTCIRASGSSIVILRYALHR